QLGAEELRPGLVRRGGDRRVGVRRRRVGIAAVEERVPAGEGEGAGIVAAAADARRRLLQRGEGRPRRGGAGGGEEEDRGEGERSVHVFVGSAGGPGAPGGRAPGGRQPAGPPFPFRWVS